MRNIIMIAFALLMHTSTFAQKWALSSSTWITGYSWMSPTYYTTIKVEGDTIIDGISCKKIGNYSPIYTYESNDTVYFYLAGKFRPTYYFNAHVGDTISFYNANYSDGFCGNDSILYAVIDNIDSIDVGNKFLRKFCGSVIGDTTIPNCNGFSYTEYIGSNYIFPYTYCPDIFDQESYWICDYGDSTIQNFYVFQNNCLNVSLDEIANPKEHVLIYPIPVKDQLSIVLSIEKANSISVFDVHGKKLKVVNALIAPNNFKLDLHDFNSGMYFLHILLPNGQRLIKKFLKE